MATSRHGRIGLGHTFKRTETMLTFRPWVCLNSSSIATAKTIIASKIRFRIFRNYNDLECDDRLYLFKYLIKECNNRICIQIDIKNEQLWYSDYTI